MALEGESYCIRHTDEEAVGRCRQCGVPFCAKCRVEVAEGTYCSMECRAKHKRFMNRSEGLNRGRRGGLLKQAVVLLIIAAGIAAGLHYVGVEVPFISDLIRARPPK